MPDTDYEALEKELTQELLDEYGDDGTKAIDCFGGPGFVRRIITSN